MSVPQRQARHSHSCCPDDRQASPLLLQTVDDGRSRPVHAHKSEAVLIHDEIAVGRACVQASGHRDSVSGTGCSEGSADVEKVSGDSENGGRDGEGERERERQENESNELLSFGKEIRDKLA